jgi:hypothetical protein
MNENIDYENLTDEDCRLLEVIGWKGKIVRHFKGDLYLVLDVHIEHTETGERMILYKALYDDCKVYVRPAKMFIELCTKEQFNKYGQEYRFEAVKLESNKNS